jgi:hypothetical protein
MSTEVDEFHRRVVIDGECPVCGTEIKVTANIFDPCKPVALAYHGGVPGQKMPPTDAQQLAAIADWLDIVDDKTESSYRASDTQPYMEALIGRGLQTSLRRIAARLVEIDGQ